MASVFLGPSVVPSLGRHDRLVLSKNKFFISSEMLTGLLNISHSLNKTQALKRESLYLFLDLICFCTQSEVIFYSKFLFIFLLIFSDF